MLLILSLIAIIVGPIILQWFPQNRRLDSFLFSFVLISVAGILALDIIPVLWSNIGYWLVPLALLGFFGPSLIESSFRKAADRAHKVALLIGIIGLMLHSVMDGMAVIENSNNQMLPYAVIIHRLIAGLSIWWLVQPIWGNFKSYLIFGFMILATISGFALAEGHIFPSLNFNHALWLDYFQAIVTGTLLHVIIHRPHIDEEGHHHDHAHALAHDPEHSHSHGIVIKHKYYFLLGAISATTLLILIHQLH